VLFVIVLFTAAERLIPSFPLVPFAQDLKLTTMVMDQITELESVCREEET